MSIWCLAKPTVIKHLSSLCVSAELSVVRSVCYLHICFISQSLLDSAEPQTSRRQSQVFIWSSRSLFTLTQTWKNATLFIKIKTKASWMHRTPTHPLQICLRLKVFLKMCSEAHGNKRFIFCIFWSVIQKY